MWHRDRIIMTKRSYYVSYWNIEGEMESTVVTLEPGLKADGPTFKSGINKHTSNECVQIVAWSLIEE